MYPCARPRRQSAVGCDFRAVQALCRPLPLCPVPWSGNQPALVREAAVPGLGTTLFVVLRSTLRGGPRDPLFFVALSLSPPESWSGANSMACQKAVEIVFPISQLASK